MEQSNVSNLCFYISYIMVIFLTMFSRIPIIQANYSIIELFSIIFILFADLIASFRFKIRDMVLLLFLLLIVFLSYLKCSDPIFIYLILIIYSSRKVDFNDFIKKDFIIKLLFVLIVLLFHYIGLTNDFIISRSDGTIRNSMGFSHPNIFGLYCFMLCLELFYLVKNKNKFFYYLFFILSICIIYYFSNSRASILAIIILLLSSMFENIFPYIFKFKIIQLIIKNLFLIYSVLTAILLILCQNFNKFALLIDKLVSHRIFSILYFINTYGIKLFGNKLLLVSSEMAYKYNIQAYILDNGYFYVLIKFGVIVFLLLFLIVRKQISSLIVSKNYKLIIIFVILLTYGLVENAIFKISYTPFLLCFSNLFFKKGEIYEQS